MTTETPRKVFVPQVPSIRVEGRWVPKFNLAATSMWGELVSLARPGSASKGDIPSLHRAMASKLESELHNGDYLLLMGDPVLQAIMVAEATQLVDTLHVLKYDRFSNVYYVQDIDLSINY